MMRARVALVAIFALSLTSAAARPHLPLKGFPDRVKPAASTDWTRFRFDRNHTGYQPFETTIDASNVTTLQLKWQAELGKIVDYSSPAVAGGVAYIGTIDGRLFAYSANGCGGDFCTAPLWKSTNLAQIIDSPAVANGLVYVGSQTNDNDNDGKLNVFRAAGCGQPECPPLWQGDAGPDSILMSSPEVANGFVYVGAFDGKLYVFDASGCGARLSGALCRPAWTGSTGGPIESSPTVSGGVVYIGSNDGKLYAFPAAGCGSDACAPLWTGDAGGIDQIFDSTPAVSDGVVYVGSTHHLNAFAASGCGSSTCAPLWQGAFQDGFVNGSPAIFGGRVYSPIENIVAVFDANGCGAAACTPLWIDFAGGTQPHILSSPTIANGVLYAGKMNGEVLAWPAEPCGTFVCDELWRFGTSQPIMNSSPTVVNGTVYIGGGTTSAPENKAGRLFVFTPP